MSASILSSPIPAGGRSGVAIGDDVQIPGWVEDLASFRRWAWSDEFPKTGRFSYLQDTVWADVRMEELFSHNQVKAAFTLAILALLQHAPRGRFVVDRMLLTHVAAGLSTEPDGLFYSWDTVKSGRLRRIEVEGRGVMELEGTPDMVLEVVSRSSVRTDTTLLRNLYWNAGVREFWLADARGEQPQFDILVRDTAGYTHVPSQEGWVRSDVFDRLFRLVRQTDELGDPQYVVEVK
jgi:Uma2 family endonuclease